MSQTQKRLPIITQLLIFMSFSYLYAHNFFVKNNIFWEADYSDNSKLGSIIFCVLTCVISCFAILWLIGKIFGKDSSAVICLSSSFLVSLLVCLFKL